MKNFKVSIVVPVYNASRGGYLVQLINSILGQNYSNIELILVDNCSTDNSLEICRNFEKADNRVIVTSEPQRGASAARNKGIGIATGDYIHMCDADDIIENEIYSESMKYAHLYEPDVIRFNIATYKENELRHNAIIQQPYGTLLDRKYIIDEVIPYTIGIKVNPSKKIDSHLTLITRRDIIRNNNIRYNENQTKEEDHPFLVNILAYANSVIFLKGTYYHYLKHSGSLISTYSPRFQNFCNNFELYRTLFSEYYDFNSPTKIEYNINCAIESMEYVIYHHKDCNTKREILKILESNELNEWCILLEPNNKLQKKLKKCVESRKHTWFYFYMIGHVIFIRLNNLKDKILTKFKLRG